jgi:L-threonylcarbamoyladenylate synthase
MKNIFDANQENIKKAAEIIKKGGLVAMPTETVYGLGADVFNPKAVASIFEAKGRPSFNPLISHIDDVDYLKEYALTDERVLSLAKKYWPGPITFVLNRKDDNPALDLVCAGLKTITVRMPNHPIALELIKQAGTPIAAPSANASGTISPTTAQHVYDSLGFKVDMILDGGPCKVGVESTILDLTGKDMVLLRPGGITKEELEEFTNEKILVTIGSPDMPKSPGQLLSHYAPEIPLYMNKSTRFEDNQALIGFGDMECDYNLSLSKDLREAAANLFAFMKAADKSGKFTSIAVAPIPNEGLGMAINDRLTRASYKS